MDHTQSYLCPSELTAQYLAVARSNIQRFMDHRNLSQKRIETDLKSKGILLRQTTLGNFLNSDKSITLGALVELAKYFGVTVDQLLTPNLDPASLDNAQTEAFTPPSPVTGKHFVKDPYAPEFHGFLQTYYVYALSARSGEHRLLTGTLTLRPAGEICEAILSIDSDHHQSKQDTYTGYAFVSRTIRTVYIVMFSEDIGEMLTLSMRHHSFYYKDQILNCRMAAMFSNGPGVADSPTMRRLILSREEIQPKDIPFLTPHLHMNSSDICIQHQALAKLCMNSPHYDDLGAALQRFDTVDTYYWSEEFVLGMGKQFLSDDELHVFLSQIRDLSAKSRFIKISPRADHVLSNLLTALGYYRD